MAEDSATLDKAIDSTAMYSSVRQEILDQKKCQFQLFAASATLTAAVLAYAGRADATPLVYVAPMLLNVLSLTIILDKAISIQRMVGYLQLMESKRISVAGCGSITSTYFEVCPVHRPDRNRTANTST
jgi:hypothetical protein